MIILTYFIFSFAVLRMVVALVNLISSSRLKENDKNADFVSVLIPARNEEKRLPTLLKSLLVQKHKHFEVIIYDDESTDKSADIIKQTAQNDTRITYLKGPKLPEGWLGKNHACHQLSLAARGEYLLFLDADVETGAELISRSLTYLKNNKLSLLSIFPFQIMVSFGERITVPVMNWILVSLLPMFLIKKSRWSSFAAANGQFMLFKAKDYKKNWFHQRLKNQKVEDIKISRLMKSKAYRVDTLLGDNQIKCRMYNNFHEAVYGFSKNVTEYFGGNVAVTILFGLITSFGWTTFLYAKRFELLIFYLATLVLTRIFISIASRQNPMLNIIYMPLQQLSFILIVLQSVKNKLSQKYTWKGRTI